MFSTSRLRSTDNFLVASRARLRDCAVVGSQLGETDANDRQRQFRERVRGCSEPKRGIVLLNIMFPRAVADTFIPSSMAAYKTFLMNAVASVAIAAQIEKEAQMAKRAKKRSSRKAKAKAAPKRRRRRRKAKMM
jgi:hypothetical protein